MQQVYTYALFAALNPTLLAATTVMLVLPNPKRLLLGYLLGASMTSITLGLVIVFSLDGSSSTTSTARQTIDPIWDVVLGTLILVAAFVIGTGRDRRLQARNARKRETKADKPPPKWQQRLSGGTARTTFGVGALLTLPGASYLGALKETSQQGLTTTEAVLVVISINVIMLMALEIPLIGFAVAPDTTAGRVERFGAWLTRSRGRIGLILAVILALALIGRGIAGLL
jgi:hypothetical protein